MIGLRYDTPAVRRSRLWADVYRHRALFTLLFRRHLPQKGLQAVVPHARYRRSYIAVTVTLYASRTAKSTTPTPLGGVAVVTKASDFQACRELTVGYTQELTLRGVPARTY